MNIKYIPPQLRNIKNRKCCGGIIIYNDKFRNKIYIIIINDRASSKWGLPKGGIEKNESYIECAMREIKEETGLNIKLTENTKKIKIHGTYYYLINLINMNINIKPIDTNEISAIRWIDINKINNNYRINRELRDVLLKRRYILREMDINF